MIADEVAGLKANNDKLLAEKKEAKRLAEEAAAQQLLASQEAARKSGELEAFEKTLRGEYVPQLEAKDKIIAARNERILSSEKKAIVNSLSGMMIDESAADILGVFVRTEFDGMTSLRNLLAQMVMSSLPTWRSSRSICANTKRFRI